MSDGTFPSKLGDLCERHQSLITSFSRRESGQKDYEVPERPRHDNEHRRSASIQPRQSEEDSLSAPPILPPVTAPKLSRSSSTAVQRTAPLAAETVPSAPPMSAATNTTSQPQLYRTEANHLYGSSPLSDALGGEQRLLPFPSLSAAADRGRDGHVFAAAQQTDRGLPADRRRSRHDGGATEEQHYRTQQQQQTLRNPFPELRQYYSSNGNGFLSPPLALYHAPATPSVLQAVPVYAHELRADTAPVFAHLPAMTMAPLTSDGQNQKNHQWGALHG